VRAAALLMAAGLLAAGCSGAGGGQVAAGGSVLTVAPNPTGPFARAFNPFLPTSTSATGFADNLIYEPLMMVDYNSDTYKPWLATAYKWSNGGRVLTLTLRTGVKWSDGQPFSASDVAYTYGLLRKYPVLNNGGLPVTSATAPNPATAVIHFSGPAYTDLDNALGLKPVPEHIWGKVTDPATYQDSSPVGTGPYLLSTFSPQTLTFTKNPKYWQANGIRVTTLRYQAFDSPSSEEAAMETGQIDWEDHVFTDFSKLTSRPHISGQNTSNGVTFILPNENRYPLNLLPVREAISEAIDRTALSTAEGSGQHAATSPTGFMSPQTRFIAPAYTSMRYGGAEPAKARATLENAGFTMGGNGVFRTPKGTPLQLTMLLGSGQENLITLAQVMRQELAAAGIGMNIQTETFSAVTTDVRSGNFDLNIYGDNGNFDPYNYYLYLFDPAFYSPPGKLAQGDLSRYQDPAAEKLFKELETLPPSSAQASSVTASLEKVMVDRMPVIPLNTTATQWAFRTDTFTGWPTTADPYAFAEPLDDNVELVMLHLRPR